MEIITIRKHSKRDHITPKLVKSDPESSVREFIKYFVYVQSRYTDPERGLWGTNTSGWHKGIYTYTTSLVIPHDTSDNFQEILLKRDPGLFDDEEVGQYPLCKNLAPGDYSGIIIPQSLFPKLMPYVSIYGGLTEASTPLTPLYEGCEIKRQLPVP